jgi:hypothetical protein
MNEDALSVKLLSVLRQAAELCSNRIYDSVEESFVEGYSQGFLRCILEEMQLSQQQIDIASKYLDNRIVHETQQTNKIAA